MTFRLRLTPLQLATVILLQIIRSSALDNGLGRLPIRGVSSWCVQVPHDHLHCAFTDSDTRGNAVGTGAGMLSFVGWLTPWYRRALLLTATSI